MKIEEQVLSREQMKHLQELGVDTSDASMVWIVTDKIEKEENNSDAYPHYHLALSVPTMIPAHLTITAIPTYTIGDLIEKLPKNIRNYDLEIHCDFNCLGYAAASDFEYSIEYDRLIYGLYDLLCWVAENHKELLEVKK